MKQTVREFVEQVLKINVTVESNKGWLRACCPVHEERRPSFGVLSTYPYVAKCFGCGFRASLAELTAKILKTSKERALQIINDKIDIKLSIESRDTGRVFYVSDAVAEMYEECFSGSMADKYARYRKIPKWAARLWQLGYDDLSKALVVPLRNTVNNKIQSYLSVEFQGTFSEVFKYKPENAGLAVTVPVNHHMFEDCVVVEGYVDAIKVAQSLWSSGVWAVPVAINTIIPTREQLKFIRRFNRVYLAFDHDESGKRGREFCADKLGDKAFVYDVVYPAELKDPGELTPAHEVTTKLILGGSHERSKLVFKGNRRG